MSRPRRAPSAVALALFAVVAVASSSALAQPADEITAMGPMDYEPLAPGTIVESIVLNEVTMTFPLGGGPFAATAMLVLHHDVPSQGCAFESQHEWSIVGEFHPETLEFLSTFEEVEERTDRAGGDCPNFSFVRTFEPDEGDFTARLDPVAGEITTGRTIEPMFFTLEVDPALVESLVPTTSPPSTVDPNATTPGDGATTPGDGTTTPGDGTTTPGDGTTTPDDGTTTPDDEPIDEPSGAVTTLTLAEDVPQSTDPSEVGSTAEGGGAAWPWIVVPIALIGGLGGGTIWLRRRSQGMPGPDTPLHDPTAIDTGSSLSGEELAQIPPGSDIFPPEQRPLADAPVTGEELDRIPVAPPDDGGEPAFGAAPVPGGGPPQSGDEEGDIDCSKLERLLREAEDDCAEAEAAADQIGRDFDQAERDLQTAKRARAALPSEETRVELPDGRSLSQLDLDLRRRAAAGAWDAYMADPSPETAQAAEDAWNEQATPEWLDEQRRAHEAEKQRLDSDADTARAAKEGLGKQLTEARDRQQEACTKAAKLKEKLEACRRAEEERRAKAEAEAKAKAEAEAKAKDEAERKARAEEAASRPPPVAAPGGDSSRPEPCRPGAFEWRKVGDRRSFASAEGGIAIKLTAAARKYGTPNYANALPSLDKAPFVLPGAGGHAASIPLDDFAPLTPEAIESAFSDLPAVWNGLGSTKQVMTLTLSAEVGDVYVACERLYRCVDGEWQPQDRWRTDETKGSTHTVSDRVVVAVTGDYMAEITAFFAAFRQKVSDAIDGQRGLEAYRENCKKGG